MCVGLAGRRADRSFSDRFTKTHKNNHRRYLRALEEVVIRAVRPLGVEAGREEGLTGVWTEKGKVAVRICFCFCTMYLRLFGCVNI